MNETVSIGKMTAGKLALSFIIWPRITIKAVLWSVNISRNFATIRDALDAGQKGIVHLIQENRRLALEVDRQKAIKMKYFEGSNELYLNTYLVMCFWRDLAEGNDISKADYDRALRCARYESMARAICDAYFARRQEDMDL